MTVLDWIIPVVAVLALLLSGYNTYMQRKERRPRVDLSTYWVHPDDAPMALRSTANPTAPVGKAIYRCEITNVGVAGVKIRQVSLYPQAPPGKPIPLRLPEGEQSRKLDNGDSQTWSICIELDPEYKPDLRVPGHVIAWDTVGDSYKAENPTPFPYPYI